MSKQRKPRKPYSRRVAELERQLREKDNTEHMLRKSAEDRALIRLKTRLEKHPLPNQTIVCGGGTVNGGVHVITFTLAELRLLAERAS